MSATSLRKSTSFFTFEYSSVTVFGIRATSIRQYQNGGGEKARHWRVQNPDKVEEVNQRYRERHPEKVRARKRAYKQNHPEYIAKERQRALAYAATHRESARKRAREWHNANPERAAEQARKWREANPDKKKAAEHNRNARKRGNGGSWTVEEWQN